MNRKIKTLIFWIFGIILYCLDVSGETFNTEQKFQPETVSSSSVFVWRQVENKSFLEGEKLSFSIKWGLITAGYAEMRIENIQEISNRKAYHIVAESRSLPFFDAFYKVRNYDKSWIDVESVCSLKYEKHQQEGGYVKEETTIFDQVNKKFQLIEKIGNKEPVNKQGEISIFIQDILSALYYLRTQELEVGKEYYITTQSGDKSYPLMVVVYRKEKINVPAGRFECFVVEPFMSKDTGIFRAKGRLWIWMTADNKKMPVLMKSKIFIGYISAELIQYKF